MGHRAFAFLFALDTIGWGPEKELELGFESRFRLGSWDEVETRRLDFSHVASQRARSTCLDHVLSRWQRSQFQSSNGRHLGNHIPAYESHQSDSELTDTRVVKNLEIQLKFRLRLMALDQEKGKEFMVDVSKSPTCKMLAPISVSIALRRSSDNAKVRKSASRLLKCSSWMLEP